MQARIRKPWTLLTAWWVAWQWPSGPGTLLGWDSIKGLAGLLFHVCFDPALTDHKERCTLTEVCDALVGQEA